MGLHHSTPAKAWKKYGIRLWKANTEWCKSARCRLMMEQERRWPSNPHV